MKISGDTINKAFDLKSKPLQFRLSDADRNLFVKMFNEQKTFDNINSFAKQLLLNELARNKDAIIESTQNDINAILHNLLALQKLQVELFEAQETIKKLQIENAVLKTKNETSHNLSKIREYLLNLNTTAKSSELELQEIKAIITNAIGEDNV